MRIKISLLIIILVGLLLSYNEEKTVKKNGEMSSLLQVCDCKGKSGNSIDEAFRSILEEGSYDAGLDHFSNQVLSSKIDIEDFIKTEFERNESFTNCVCSFEIQSYLKDNTKKLDHMILADKKYGCYKFIAYFLQTCE